MVGWHHWLNGHEFEQAPGDGKGQGNLVCCSPWGCKELDTTEQLNNNFCPLPGLLVSMSFIGSRWWTCLEWRPVPGCLRAGRQVVPVCLGKWTNLSAFHENVWPSISPASWIYYTFLKKRKAKLMKCLAIKGEVWDLLKIGIQKI